MNAPPILTPKPPKTPLDNDNRSAAANSLGGSVGGRKNVVRILDAWYAACQSKDVVDKRPTARMINGVPLVLFRDRTGRVGALIDRCPHRNVPLSLGSVDNGELKCRYHGWRFD